MSIFGTINMPWAALFLIGILLFTLVWEEATERLEYHLSSRSHYAAMLAKVYRELMILGFISFAVVISNELSLMSHRYLIAFELAHLLVFGVSMFYILITVTSAWKLERTENEWARMAQASTTALADELKSVLTFMQKKGQDAKGWVPLWSEIYKIAGKDPWEDAEWKILRLLFLHEFHIGTEFDYSKYVRKKLETRLAHSLHVHGSTWGSVMLVALLFMVAETIGIIDMSEEDKAAAGGGHRRQLASKEAFPSSCNIEQKLPSTDPDEEYAKATWTCATSRMYVYQPTVNDTRQHICLLEEYHTYEEPETGWGSILFPILLAWLTFAAQMYVVVQVKHGLHRVFQVHGCADAMSLPQFMLNLNAKVIMKSLLAHVPMFEGCGEGFLDAIMEGMTPTFFKAKDIVCRKGNLGHSMYFICEGKADIITGTGAVLGTLSKGDFAGEMAILLNQPRTANIVARTNCTICELDSNAVFAAGELFPAALERLLTFAANRATLAAAGNFDTQANKRAKQSEEEAIAAHAVKLKMVEKQKARQEANKEPESSLKITDIMPTFDKTLVAPGKIADAGVALGKKVGSMVLDPKKVAKLVGLPGTGVVDPNSSYAHHRSLDRMQHADRIMPKDRGHLNEEISEIALLFSCFNFAWWVLRMVPNSIPNFKTGFFGSLIIHFLILFPIGVTTLHLAPVTTKLSCLLDSVLYKDSEVIADTYHLLAELIGLKLQIHNVFMNAGLQLARDHGDDDSEAPSAVEVAALLFKELDTEGIRARDEGGRGEAALDYKTLKRALRNMGCQVSSAEFLHLTEFIDPNRDGLISITEWTAFIRSSPEQLETNEWLAADQQIALRRRLRGELARKSIALQEDLSTLLAQIFTTMDVDDSNSLSPREITDGLETFGIELVENDIQTILEYVDENGMGELTLYQWEEFVNIVDDTEPEPNEVDDEYSGVARLRDFAEEGAAEESQTRSWRARRQTAPPTQSANAAASMIDGWVGGDDEEDLQMHGNGYQGETSARDDGNEIVTDNVSDNVLVSASGNTFDVEDSWFGGGDDDDNDRDSNDGEEDMGDLDDIRIGFDDDDGNDSSSDDEDDDEGEGRAAGDQEDEL